tara:strand:- start:11758 stop:12006 length:249 start_codon:yes stop_codon:yes gene_type:complete
MQWRDSARVPKILILDYRALSPLLFLIIYPSFITLGISIVVIIFFAILEQFGFTLTIFIRFLLYRVIAGKHKFVVPWWYKKR